uniref:receptor protein-tyrosine kinase n=1 Tax=Panagrellus redivivus TaxID=6233 RepID=A0A7E4VGI0_PANRE
MLFPLDCLPYNLRRRLRELCTPLEAYSIQKAAPHYYGLQTLVEIVEVEYLSYCQNLNEFEFRRFHEATHSYFVGSAKQPNTSPFSFNHKNYSNVKITGICNSDNTVDLSSRIDLVLSCEGIPAEKNATLRATAVLFLLETSNLLVAFQQDVLGIKGNYICSYKLTDGVLGDDRFHNCDMHTVKRKFKAFDFSENLKPFDGRLLFNEKHSQPIVAIREIPIEGTLYALRKDNILFRLQAGDSETYGDVKAGRHLLEVQPKSNKVLFVPAHSENTINIFTSSCKGSCHSTSTVVPTTYISILTGYEYDQVPLYTQSNPRKVQLNPEDLVVLKTQQLGSGISAIVYKGCFKTSARDYEPVAVKIFRNEYALLVNTNELIDELKVSRRVHHSNIVAFIGHTYIDRTLHIVTEFMAGGSLYDYITNDSNVLKYQHTFNYLDQILSAMVYLTQQHIVHRDLAARNCLLNLDYTVLKVSDFGLARSVDFKGEYQILHIDTALPTRWIALEVFLQHKFTQKSDVWSFGVLVWELFTRGNTPYFPLDHCQILKFLNSGQRLQCPETCPDQIYALMITCWDVEPRKRPTFKKLKKNLAAVLTYFTDSNKRLIESGYERPNSQPLPPL